MEYKSNTIIFIIALVISNLACKAQEIDTVNIYKGYFKDRTTLPPKQVIDFILLKADSTYEQIIFRGPIDDSEENYLTWEKSITEGLWYIENNKTLYLKYGNVNYQYKIKKKCIKLKKFQKSSNGYIARYNKWIFEQKPKYCIISNIKKAIF